MDEKLQTLKKLASGISVLYVEDNAGLRKNMHNLLSRIFDNIFIAEDGSEGYKLFVKHHPQILITDINMPKMNGFEMIKKIKTAAVDSKVIVMSAYDDNKDLHLAIELGVFRYLSKPAKIPELMEALYDTVVSIHEEENRRVFLNQLKSIFNYQNNMVVMMQGGELILANQRFMEFFGVDDLEGFVNTYRDMDKVLLEHTGFLYSTPYQSWYDTASGNVGKLFHTKIENHQDEKRHLILKLREVPEKDGQSILSFDDVTELNLMELFDGDETKPKDKESVIALMKVVKENAAEVKIHNFYKGLTIVNPAIIMEISDDDVTLKTVNAQLKIIQMCQFMTISADVFPSSVICRSIKAIDMDHQNVVINDMSFSPRSATDRKHIRLEPEAEHSCTLFYKQIKFAGETRLIDLSEVSAKIEINAMPPGMRVEDQVKISMQLNSNGRWISLVTDASIYRIDENIHSYSLVLLFDLSTPKYHEIKEYLGHRQMALIREFKQVGMAALSQQSLVGNYAI